MLIPKLYTIIKQGYSKEQLKSDITAGVIVGIVALPLAIAFSIASGVSPDRGLVSAIIAGFMVSLLGGSRVQIGGPTGAFVIIVLGIVQQYGIDGLVVTTFIGGMILIIFGLCGFGGVIKFIPQPVTVGFTSGIALIIFTTQVKDFFGLNIEKIPSDFVNKLIAYAQHIKDFNPYALITAISTIIIMIVWKKIYKKIPGSLISMLMMTAIVNIFKFPVETIGSTFGEIPNALPKPHIPNISLSMIKDLFSPSITVALLAGIESLLSAVVADSMIGAKHRSNMELVAQGAANIATAAFGGMPVTGAIARTAVNIQNGGRTPVSGIIHSITLLIIMVFLGKFAVLVPLPCLAGILVMVSIRMAEWRSFVMILKTTKSDALVLFATFLLTVFFDLTVAIQSGVILAAFLLIRRLSQTTNVKAITKDMYDTDETEYLIPIKKEQVPESVEVFEIQGPLFFGMISSFMEAINDLKKTPKVRIIRMRAVLSVDATAIDALMQTHRLCVKHGITLLLCGVHAQPLIALQNAGLLNDIGEGNIFNNIDEAIEYAKTIVRQ